jgi:hypothetical protein
MDHEVHMHQEIRVRPFCKIFFSLISEIKWYWIRFTCVSLVHYKISLIFFRFFSLCFTLVIFALHKKKPQNIASIQNFSHYFASQFRCEWKKTTFLSIFSLNFRFASIFSLKFRLFYLHFHFRFLLFRIKVNHVKSGFFRFQAKRNFRFNFKFRFRSESEDAPYTKYTCTSRFVWLENISTSMVQRVRGKFDKLSSLKKPKL